MGVVYCSLLWRACRKCSSGLCCPFGHRELVTLNRTLRCLIRICVSVASKIQSVSFPRVSATAGLSMKILIRAKRSLGYAWAMLQESRAEERIHEPIVI
jgi:hypothetical protein